MKINRVNDRILYYFKYSKKYFIDSKKQIIITTILKNTKNKNLIQSLSIIQI